MIFIIFRYHRPTCPFKRAFFYFISEGDVASHVVDTTPTMSDFFLKCCMGCDEEEYNPYADVLRQNDVLDLQPNRYVGASRPAGAVAEKTTGPARGNFESGPSDFMPMSKVVEQVVAKEILAYSQEIQATRLNFGLSGSEGRRSRLEEVEVFFTDKGFHAVNLFPDNWRERALHDTGYQLKNIIGTAIRNAMQVLQGRCACSRGRAGECMDIGAALHFAR